MKQLLPQQTPLGASALKETYQKQRCLAKTDIQNYLRLRPISPNLRKAITTA